MRLQLADGELRNVNQQARKADLAGFCRRLRFVQGCGDIRSHGGRRRRNVFRGASLLRNKLRQSDRPPAGYLMKGTLVAEPNADRFRTIMTKANRYIPIASPIAACIAKIQTNQKN